jgi:hypothetical protein
MPISRVEIEDVGTLSFPVPDAQIADVIRRAERALYGKGEATVVDTSVRKVWQISAGHVRIGGKSWNVNFENILSKVKTGLGCDDAIVTAELYKLLCTTVAASFWHTGTPKKPMGCSARWS